MEEIEIPPTRAEHIRAGEKLADELGFVGELATEFARAYADARASERHAARVRYVRAGLLDCLPDHVREETPELANELAGILAHLVLFGQGGPRDAGGPMAASQLPILPPDRQFRWRRRCGGAWVAAIREIAATYRVSLVASVDAEGVHVTATVRDGGSHWLATVGHDGGVTWGNTRPEWGACLARALVGREWVSGETHDVPVVRRTADGDVSVGHPADEALRRLVASRLVGVVGV